MSRKTYSIVLCTCAKAIVNVYYIWHDVIILLPRGQSALLTKLTIRGLPMSKKILVMDDDPTNADLLREALADEGYDTVMTTQSLRFCDAVTDYKPDLITLE